jgi:hypothetical protein
MTRHTRNAIAALIAVVGLLATVVPAQALGFLLPTRFSMKKIETMAPYVPQTSCQPAAKIGTVSLQAYLQKKYPGTGSDGISRACNIGGRSEHKEGRAFDWAVNYYNPKQRAQAEAMLHWLLKRDKMGRQFANARRLGVMYVIWDRQIWSTSDPVWRPYSGASAHRDHVHISLSWAGARGKTSFWTGNVARTITPYDPVISNASATPTATAKPVATSTPTASPSPTSSGTVASGHASAEEEQAGNTQEDATGWYWDKFRK